MCVLRLIWLCVGYRFNICCSWRCQRLIFPWCLASFLGLQCENLVGSLEVKPTQGKREVSDYDPQEFLTLSSALPHSAPGSSPQNCQGLVPINFCSRSSYLCVTGFSCLFRFQSEGLPCAFHSLMLPR